MVFAPNIIPVGADGPGLESLGRLVGTAAPVIPSMPWRISIGADGIELRLDRTRLPQHGVDARLIDVGCGAVAHNLRLGLRDVGADSVLYVASRAADPDLLAVLSVVGPAPAPDPAGFTAASPLAGAGPGGAFALRAMSSDAVMEGAGLRVLDPADAVVASLLVDEAAWELGIAAPAWAALAGGAAAPSIVVLGTADDTRSDRLRAGHALQRVLLTAHRYGVATRLLMEPWQCAATAARVDALAPSPLRHAQAMVLLVPV